MLRSLEILPCLTLSRRQWLSFSLLSGLATLRGKTATADDGPEPTRPPGFGRAKSVILVFCNGGQSHIDTFDPKPDAPDQIRGEFRTIDTSVPGVFVTEHLPRVARLADRFTIVRGMTHDDLDHGSAVYLSLTGRFHARKSSNPPPKPDDEPTHGAVLHRVRPAERFPYSAVYVNGPALVPEEPAPGQFAGLLGPAHEPLILGDVTEERAAVPGLAPLPELSAPRAASRRDLLSQIDALVRRADGDPALARADAVYRQAFEVLASPQCRRAFDLSLEPEKLRDRYGRYRSGQACLMARRLVEAGVPLVTVMLNQGNRSQDKHPGEIDFYGWDTHNDIFQALREHLLPRFDVTFSALLEDLDDRGLLDTTLVICLGEFGRAPKVALEPRFAGSTPGRKHWASAYSIVLAGAGVGRGKVFGASDKIGANVADSPVAPGDIVATMFSALGIDPAGHYTDNLGRPFAIATGRPVAGLY